MAASFTLTIRDAVDATPRARLVRVELGGTVFPFEPGQAVMAGLAPAGTLKPYSLACTPAQARVSGCLELLVSVTPRDRQSRHLGFAAPGRPVTVSEAAGSFVLPHAFEQQHLLLLAGGSGVAPLRAQLWDALERRQPRRVTLVYSARTPDDFCFDREFRRLHDEQRIHYLPTVTRGAVPSWTGHRGRVDRSWLRALVTDEATFCSVCGPDAFVMDVLSILDEAGIPEAHVLRERP